MKVVFKIAAEHPHSLLLIIAYTATLVIVLLQLICDG
jgi:hypothetical protein